MSKKGKKKNEVPKNTTAEGPIFLDKSNNITIAILAKPGAKQNAITGIGPEGVEVQINAPPSEGEANTELVKYIASVLDLRKSNVIFDKGFKSRNKTLKVMGNITVDEVISKFKEQMS